MEAGAESDLFVAAQGIIGRRVRTRRSQWASALECNSDVATHVLVSMPVYLAPIRTEAHPFDLTEEKAH